MRVQRFDGHVTAGPRGRAIIAVPFDPDEMWGAKAEHPVGGTINGRRVRGTVAPGASGWAFSVTPMWMRDAGLAVGDDIMVELAPEGPQRGDLADDISAALAANPAAAAFFDTLAQFDRKAYLRWIDATTRRPDLRAARIAEVVDLLAAGIKQRPRSLAQQLTPAEGCVEGALNGGLVIRYRTGAPQSRGTGRSGARPRAGSPAADQHS